MCACLVGLVLAAHLAEQEMGGAAGCCHFCLLLPYKLAVAVAVHAAVMLSSPRVRPQVSAPAPPCLFPTHLMMRTHHPAPPLWFSSCPAGVLTALALFIHNFPEGLATFVGALADTKIGVGLGERPPQQATPPPLLQCWAGGCRLGFPTLLYSVCCTSLLKQSQHQIHVVDTHTPSPAYRTPHSHPHPHPHHPAAVAIAMHNIPEGICVAMPIYYATGSRWKVRGDVMWAGW